MRKPFLFAHALHTGLLGGLAVVVLSGYALLILLSGLGNGGIFLVRHTASIRREIDLAERALLQQLRGRGKERME